ncbi:aminotransferase class IV [Sphingobacterium suaedae]|uniref:branched-chain-amino-acid transaminase n=1 Tax=Sphingobacterium suaedae TaxID=1686402 RepID=A0ABW5KHK4_9SPHI
MQPPLQAIINGRLLYENEAALSIHDLSIVRGYGIFDYFKTVNHDPVFWEDNLDRFYHSACLMDLPVPYTRDELKSQIRLLMGANNIADSGIKLLLTGGISPDGYSIARPNLVITQHPLKRHLEKERAGIKLITYDYHRPFGTVKSIDYVMGIHALKKAKAVGAEDVVYAQHGVLSECPRANIFFIDQNGTLLTPQDEVLPGITRKYVLEVARGHMNVETRAVTLGDMYDAQEAFITSTTKNITPVLRIDNVEYGKEPGPVTRLLQRLLEPLVYTGPHGSANSYNP